MPVPTTPYDPANYVTNKARVICNDAGLTLAGELLADSQPYTVELLNAAYRDLQEDLTNNAVETFAQETILQNIGAVVSPTDPSILINISYTGYNNGSNNFALPILPPDMVGPLFLWERMTGSLQNFYPMEQCSDGLPSRAKWTFNREWEWRSDAIWMPGATQANDVRLRYNRFLPELVLSPVPSQIQILRADRALAYRIATIFAEARGPEATASLESSYRAALKRMVMRTSHRKQRANHRRRPRSEGLHAYWGDFY